MRKFLASTLTVLTLALTLVVSGDVTTLNTDVNTDESIDLLHNGDLPDFMEE